MTLRQKVLQGGAFLALRQGIGMLIGLVSVLLITRTIGPAAFGTYATVIAIFTYLVLLGQLGIGVYLIRRPEAPSHRELHVAFSLLLAVSVTLALITSLLAGLFAQWLNNPAVASVAVVMFLGLPLQVASAVPLALLERQLNYRVIAMIELAGQVAYVLVALPLAYLEFSVWAAVLGWWAQLALTSGAYLISSGYQPRWIWSHAQASDMLRYGFGYSSSLWAWQLRSLVSPLIVGRFLGPEAVAYISLALRFVELLSFVKSATWRIAVAALGRMQHDPPRMARAINEGMRLQVLAVGLPLFAFASLGPFIIERVFGPSWAPSMSIYPFIALAVLSNAAFNLHSSALYVLQRNSSVTAFHLVHVALFALSAALLTPRLGLLGYGWAELIALPSYLVIQAAARRHVGRIEPGVTLLWVVALGCALFLPQLGWLALLPALITIVLPSTRLGLTSLLTGIKEARYGTTG